MLLIANLVMFTSIGFFSLGAVLAQPTVQIITYTATPDVFSVPVDQEAKVAMAEIFADDTVPSASESIQTDPFDSMFVDSLAGRAAGGGALEDLGAMNCDSENFSRRHFRYPSEGMEMYGFINIPEGEGPYPVIILLHGHVKRDGYKTLAYTSRYADALTENGYIVMHPNLCGYLPTPDAENKLGVGDTVDVLRLISIIRQTAGRNGLLEKADPANIGLWGHSMGGGIVMRVMEIDPEIKAGLLYAAVHLDENVNLSHFNEDGRGYEKCQAPEESMSQISPLNFLERVNSPISIHHGDKDERVTYLWSEFLYNQLDILGKNVTYNVYNDQLHTFRGSGDVEFTDNSVEFFDRYLKQ